MALINQNVSALTNGVSQQPDVVRLDSQAAEQLNGISDVLDGVGPRPPSEIVAELSNSYGNDRAKMSIVTDDEGEDYVVVINNVGQMEMRKLSDGTAQTITFGAGSASYISTTTPNTSISVTTAGSTLFILNKDKVPALTSDTSPALSDYALVWIKQGRDSYPYEISVKNYAMPWTIPNTDFDSYSGQKNPYSNLGSNWPASFYSGYGTTWIAPIGDDPPPWRSAGIGGIKSAIGLGQPWSDSSSVVLDSLGDPVFGDIPDDQRHDSIVFASVYRLKYDTNATALNQKSAIASEVADIFNAHSGSWVAEATSPTSGRGAQLGIWRAKAEGDLIRLYKRTDSSNVIAGTPYTTGKGPEDATFFSSDEATSYSVNHKRVATLDDLPLTGAPDGYKVMVAGSADSDIDDFYVTYTEADGWKECAAPGIQHKLDPATMPFVLQKDTSTPNTWILGAGAWGEREAGDQITAPEPSFVGKKIVDIAVHKNRLVVATEDSFIFSRSGDLTNFWVESARDVLDTDPIDIEVSNAGAERGVGVFAMASLDQFLIGFGRTAQVVISGAEDSYTPTSVGADVSSYYDISTLANPIVLGSRAYFFGQDNGAFSSVWEYGQARAGQFSAANMTAQIPEYIPISADLLTGSLDENTLVCASAGSSNRHKIFVHRQFFANNEKIQSSWSRWEFDSDISVLGAKFQGDDLYIISRHPAAWDPAGTAKTFIEKISFNQEQTEIGKIPYNLRLDHRDQYLVSALTTVFEGDENRTKVLVPRELATSNGTVVVGGSRFGLVINDPETLTVGSSKYVYIPGKLEATDTLYFGRRYPFEYTLSKLSYKRQGSTGPIPVTSGRLQLKKMRLGVKDSGPLSVVITPQGRDPFTRVFTPRVLDVNTKTDTPIVPEYDVFEFDVGCDARSTEIKFVNDSVGPGVLINYEWFANFFDKFTGRGA